MSARAVVRTVERVANRDYTNYVNDDVRLAPPGVREAIARAIDARIWFNDAVEGARDIETGFARPPRTPWGAPPS